MAIQITTGVEGYKVLDSGTLITFRNEPVTFQLANDLKIRMSFRNDGSGQQRLDYNVISPHELELVLTNFNNSLGSGNAQPLPLARLDNRQVYLNFAVYAFDESSNKIVHYTWYSREEVANG
jgi:hypothetical protein